MAIYLVKKYPYYTIINYDKLDYCSSLEYLSAVADSPNYKFVKVGFKPIPNSLNLSREIY